MFTQPLTFVVLGQPIGKARARVVRNQIGGVHAFTPAKTQRWERTIAGQAQTEMRDLSPFLGPLKLEFAAEFAIPTSWARWKREAALRGEIGHTTKPDGDNVLKAIKDALQGVVWLDDCQVTQVHGLKRYSEQPKLIVTVTPLQVMPAQVQRRPAA